MSRRLILLALGALLLGLPVSAQAQSSTSTPVKESGNPINDQGSNYNYRSNITSVAPSVPGLDLEVLEFADRLVLSNHTGKTVTVYGYQGEPYARVLADGTVQINTRSPAYYLNQNFYGNVNVPPSASPTATPHWTVIDRTGQLEWHDHRIHWMSPVVPPQVKDKGKRTKIFDWQVPIQVGAHAGCGRRGAVLGARERHQGSARRDRGAGRDRARGTRACSSCAGAGWRVAGHPAPARRASGRAVARRVSAVTEAW